MIQNGIEGFIEVGPGKVLTGLMKRIDSSRFATNVEDMKTLKGLLHPPAA
jgi:[acyl-carrier-protein] S-malonyltransferase